MHVDYAFFRNQMSDEDRVTVLVGRERWNVTSGGWGRSKKIMIRCGSEPAILDLANKLADLRTGQTLIEIALVGDSWANGRAEKAVQTLEKQERVHLRILWEKG